MKIEETIESPLMNAFCKLGVWLFAKVSDHVADGECDEWCDEVMKRAVKLGLARREEWNLAQHSHIDGEPGDLVWSWGHLPEGWRDGKYENQEDYLGGRLYESMWTPERWFLTDFPGGDAAEWMSRNYPLNGQAVKEEPKEPTVTITEKEYRDLCRSADTLEWLADRGVCWRGVDTAFPGWRVGEVTEWHYANHGDIRDMVDDHREVLRHQKDRD